MVKELIDGFSRFRAEFFDRDKEIYQRLTVEGQKPKVLIICCSDSRVDPAILFNSKPGDLFVVRNVANLVPPYQPNEEYNGLSAAIEYGVKDLEVEDIVVLGHAFCGGIAALCSEALGEKLKEREFIAPWIKIAMPAVGSVDISKNKKEALRAVEQSSILNSIKNLRTFPWVRTREENKKLRIHAWWFDMKEGALWISENGKTDFRQLSLR